MVQVLYKSLQTDKVKNWKHKKLENQKMMAFGTVLSMSNIPLSVTGKSIVCLVVRWAEACVLCLVVRWAEACVYCVTSG